MVAFVLPSRRNAVYPIWKSCRRQRNRVVGRPLFSPKPIAFQNSLPAEACCNDVLGNVRTFNQRNRHSQGGVRSYDVADWTLSRKPEMLGAVTSGSPQTKRRTAKTFGLILCVGILLLAEGGRVPTATSAVPVFTVSIINVYPHDRNAFTQGLVFENGVLYEGTGLRGRSTLRRANLETGEILQIRKLPDHLFGEGITVFGERIIQLTWQAGIGFVYDRATFELLGEFRYPTQGWGITHDGECLIVSDGTSTLRFLDPATFEGIGSIEVRDRDGPVPRLNELEYVKGEIYANVWQTDRIARIAPNTGAVVGWIDLTGILKPEDRIESVDVPNGIAYDAGNDRLFVTGKLWPRLFEIELVPVE